jgi:hypothetical protein
MWRGHAEHVMRAGSAFDGGRLGLCVCGRLGSGHWACGGGMLGMWR